MYNQLISLAPSFLVGVSQVSVPMELILTVRVAGSAPVADATSCSGSHWQRLSKIVRAAHRPVTFAVTGLRPDTR